MKLHLGALFLTLLGGFSPALSQEENSKTFLYLGMAGVKCSDLISSNLIDKDPAAASSWISGFFSGISAFSNEQVRDHLRDTNGRDLYEATMNRCRLDSTQLLSDAALNLAVEFAK